MKNAKYKSQIELNSEYDRAMMGLALSKMATLKPKDFLKDIDFLFRGITSIERETKKQIHLQIEAIKAAYPALEHGHAVEKLTQSKVFLSCVLKEEIRKSIYFQCIILHVYKWMKSVIKMNHDTVIQFAKESCKSEIWEECLLQLGPEIKRTTWAKAIIVASHYVRHFEEWDYELYETAQGSKVPLRYRKQKFLKTLKGPKARRNAQTLIDAGVKEKDLFGILGIGPSAIMKAIDSNKKQNLKINCEVWLNQVHLLTSEIVSKRFDPELP